MKNENLRQLLVSLGGALLAFLILFLILDWSILIAAVVAVGIYLALYFLTMPRLKVGDTYLDNLPRGEEITELLLDAKTDLDDIRQSLDQIKDPIIYRNGNDVHETGLRLVEYLKNNPDRVGAAQQFLQYYLDTARDILNKYLSLQNSGLVTDEMMKIRDATRRSMPILRDAFNKQFTNLMADDLRDIQADIFQLEKNLEKESSEIVNRDQKDLDQLLAQSKQGKDMQEGR